MTTSTRYSAQQRLDEVRRPEEIDGFDVAGYLEHLADELASHDAAPEARDAALRGALAALDKFASRVMGVRLDFLRATYGALERPFRKYLASQVLSYADDVERLRARVAGVVARGAGASAGVLADAVTDAAATVIALHTRLRAGVLAMVPPEPPEEVEEDRPPPTRAELIELD